MSHIQLLVPLCCLLQEYLGISRYKDYPLSLLISDYITYGTFTEWMGMDVGHIK